MEDIPNSTGRKEKITAEQITDTLVDSLRGKLILNAIVDIGPKSKSIINKKIKKNI